MKTSRKLLTLILAVLMLVSVLPLNAFAATYKVYLHCGPEGWGSTAYTLTKNSSSNLALYHDKASVYANYAMLPGKQVFNDQRTFIEWNTAYNATTGRGTGTSYYDYYTANKSATLYAIWGYNIQFNADGGTYPNPTSGKDIYLTYVASYNLNNQSDPKTDYSYCLPDLFSNVPTKTGCRRVASSGRPAYALLEKDLTFFCWETQDQNLTIPPTGGYMEWEYFHCADTAKGRAPEFYAIWEPSVTYNANGGSGSMSTDYLTWTGDALWDYESYTAKSNKFTKSGATFTGWNTKADGSGTSYKVGAQLGGQRKNSDPITLYAQWSDSSTPSTPTYTITFDANGGTLSGTKTYSIKTGSTYKSVIGSTMPTPTRSGYTFNGWYNEKYGYTLNLNDTFNVSENVTFKAQWTKNAETKSWTITFDPNGGTMVGSSTYGINTGDYYKDIFGSMPTATRSGYTLTGWYNEKYSYTLNMSDYFAISENATFKAQWTKNTTNTYTLTFDTNGGKMPSGYSTTYNFEADEKFIDIIGGYPVPTKSGYIFEGWRRTDWTSDFWVGGWGTQPFTFGHDVTLKAEWKAHTHEYTSSVTTKATCTTEGVRTYTCTCGDSYTEAIDVLGHNYKTTTTQPTCAEAGKTVTTCSRCGDSYEETIPATGEHDYKSTVTEPTCAEDGKTVYTCTVCGDSYEEAIPATGEHDYKSTVTEPTCAEDGKTVYTCTVCKDSYEEAIPATGEHDYKSTVTEPTCTEDGKTVYTCTVCGDSYSETIDALGHDYKATVIDATCGEGGKITYTCSRCQDSYVEVIPATGKHNYESAVTEPTCVTDGYTTYTCTVCSDSYTDNITEALGHNVIIVEGYDATCTESGLTSGTKCSVCDEIFVVQEIIEALGHDYFFDITAPTCTEEGYTTYFCFGCGDRYVADYVEPAGHDYHTIVTEATCATDGEIYYLCWECLDNYTEVIPATGKHNYESTVIAPTCTEEGKTVYTCTACGDSYTDTVVAIGHKYSSTVKDATCTEDGATVYTCDNCGDSYEEIIPSLGKHNYEYTVTDPTCENTGKIVYTCTACGDSYEAVISALGHKWGDWTVTTAPTTTSTGIETKTCSVCKATETREIPMISSGSPVIVDVFNYTVTINGIKDIKEIRFAIGHYTTGSEVKAAEKNVTLDASTVAKYTVDGVFSYELPWIGEYTFWVRTNSGEQYFLYTEVDEINPYVTSYGVKLTVNDFGENYKDMWLAEGTFYSYNEIKNSTAFKYQASANKMAVYAKTNHDFSYTMTNPGPYTVLIRYNDGSFDVIHHELTVDYPVFIENGLQVTVTNIPDIKIIRTAYGHYESVAEIKAASGVRNFNTKVIGKDTESYMIQYREEGEVTLIVEYNNGYKHFYYYNVEQKVPSMVQDGNKVTFGDLDDLYIIRYAPGKYTTSNNIKNAPGSKYLKSDAINENGEIVIDNLTSGRWSFMVQYNDESYNFYVIDVE